MLSQSLTSENCTLDLGSVPTIYTLNQVDIEMLKGKKDFAKYVKQMSSKMSSILFPSVVCMMIYEEYILSQSSKTIMT